MKKSLSILSMLYALYMPLAHAQTDTLFINEFGAAVDPAQAPNFRVSTATDTNGYAFKVYSRKGILKKVFHSAGAQATVLQGPYCEYDESGHITQQGQYNKGFKSGEWTYYYASSKRKKERQLYTSTHEYYSYQYDSITQKTEYEGAIDKFGKRTGIWKQYYFNSDSIKSISNFLIGKREGLQYEYHKNGKIKRKEQYQNNKLQKGELFDEAGAKIKYYPAFTFPQYRDYVSNYLRKEEPCTAEALKKNDFKIRIVITKEGEVADAEVLDVEQEACTQKIKAALLQMKKWKPALWENKPVKYTFETTIRLYVPRD